jgi:hypothetical protein
MSAVLQLALMALGLVAPGILAVLRVTRGRAGAIAGLGVLVGASLAAGGVEFAVSIGAGSGLIGILLGAAMARGGSATRVFVITLGAYFAIAGAAVAGMRAASREPLALDREMADAVRTQFDQVFEISRQTGSMTEVDLERMRARAAGFERWVVRLYPALIAASVAVLLLVNLVWAKDTLAARGAPTPFLDLTGWKAPEWLIWPVIAAGFATVLTQGRPGQRLALNALIVSLVPFLFQGLAIASHLMKRFGIPRWLRGALYAMSVVQPWVLTLVPVGLFDVWVDFRRLWRPRPAPRDDDAED